MDVQFRYAQVKPGQKLHIVPVLSGETNMANTALCGRHVNHHWHMTINVPLGNACGNCVRINRQRGYRRALDIMKVALDCLRN